jgi:hypothetical protein
MPPLGDGLLCEPREEDARDETDDDRAPTQHRL